MAQRGLVVAGGENISASNIRVSETINAGVLVTSAGDPFYTESASGVQVSGGSVSRANVPPGLGIGAVAVSNERPGYSVDHVTISNLSIVDTPPSAQRNIAVQTVDGAAMSNISFQNIRLQQQGDVPAIYSNAPRDSYTLSGLTMNGSAVSSP